MTTAHPMFTDTLSDCPATPSRFFETVEGDPIDVQAVLSDDSGPLVYIGQEVFTRHGIAALHDHLGELLAALDS